MHFNACILVPEYWSIMASLFFVTASRACHMLPLLLFVNAVTSNGAYVLFSISLTSLHVLAEPLRAHILS